MMNMTSEEFDRLNILAEKALNEVATGYELEELSSLLSLWNETVELNLLSGHPPLFHIIEEHQ
tara:strand:- start:254 stop:442 length:189 start_codon:yes stop_codon:yes gene_type:complete